MGQEIPQGVYRYKTPGFTGKGSILPGPLFGSPGVSEAVLEEGREGGDVFRKSRTEGGDRPLDGLHRLLGSPAAPKLARAARPRWRKRIRIMSRSMERDDRMGSTRESGELTQITPTSATP